MMDNYARRLCTDKVPELEKVEPVHYLVHRPTHTLAITYGNRMEKLSGLSGQPALPTREDQHAVILGKRARCIREAVRFCQAQSIRLPLSIVCFDHNRARYGT